MPRRRAKTIDFRARAEELRAYARELEEMGDVERAAWLQEVADMFEELGSGQSVGNIRQPVSRARSVFSRRLKRSLHSLRQNWWPSQVAGKAETPRATAGADSRACRCKRPSS
jgi:hypothetical protein